MNASGPRVLGQLLVVKLEESRWSAALERMLVDHRPSGVFLSRLRTPGATAELLARIARTLDAPPLLWLEEEGGHVGPLSAFLPPLPSPHLAAEHGPSAVERLGELIGAAMGLLGFNTNSAPTLDLAPRQSGDQGAGPILGSDPQQVARAGGAFARGLTKRKILACGKYFPGASAAEDCQSAEHCVVGKPMTRLWHEDLVPYRKLLARLPLVMVSNAAYKAYDFDILRPATESTSILQGLLRLKLRYPGLAVADLTRTPESGHALELANRVVRSIGAGCDLVIVPGDQRLLAAAQAAIEKVSVPAKIDTDRIQETFKRLRSARKRLARPSGRIRKAEVERLAREFEEFGQSIAFGATGSGRQR
ncbi:MAG TPA: glycoside hydrolase family 3 N-terminal domain-containing protein [Terriglobia bacterium]|nr:glycoside hydrolase family 3 N-terminal domain-containing protein [Terriglobia bacterium]